LGIFEIIFIAVGLSLGSLAASLSAGVHERILFKKGFRIAFVFTLFQILRTEVSITLVLIYQLIYNRLQAGVVIKTLLSNEKLHSYGMTSLQVYR
jgi:putative Mn2+ efflux pump MntP